MSRMTLGDRIRLLSRKSHELTAEERAARAKRERWLVSAGVLLVVLMMALLYIHLFWTQSPGAPRDLLLEVLNAISVGIASGFVGLWLLSASSKMRPARAIPVSVLSTTIMLVGGSAPLDIAFRMKSDIARTEIQALEMGELLEISRMRHEAADLEVLIERAAAKVRSYQAPAATP